MDLHQSQVHIRVLNPRKKKEIIRFYSHGEKGKKVGAVLFSRKGRAR